MYPEDGEPLGREQQEEHCRGQPRGPRVAFHRALCLPRVPAGGRLFGRLGAPESRIVAGVSHRQSVSMSPYELMTGPAPPDGGQRVAVPAASAKAPRTSTLAPTRSESSST